MPYFSKGNVQGLQGTEINILISDPPNNRPVRHDVGEMIVNIAIVGRSIAAARLTYPLGMARLRLW